MSDVPSARAVLARIGPAVGRKATVYLVANPDADFPRELRPDLFAYFGENLPPNGEITEHVPKRLQREGAFAKIVLVGITPNQALQLVRRIKVWFFEHMVPDSLKRAEKHRRKNRRRTIVECNRRNRHNGRRWCQQQMGFPVTN